MSGVPPPFSFPSPLHHSSHAEPLAELLLHTASSHNLHLLATAPQDPARLLIKSLPHAPCRYPSSNAVRPLSRASSATTRFLGSGYALSKSYENRSHPTQAAIGLDIDYSDAVGPPSSPESRSFVRACPLQWLPVLMAVVGMPPPSPPLHPGSQYAYSSSDLIAALNDRAVSRIVLKAGTYEFDNDMCSNEGGSALCIDRDVTIEAEVAGTVVLNAKGARRVIYVAAAGRAELVGLNITGGKTADHVSFSSCTQH